MVERISRAIRLFENLVSFSALAVLLLCVLWGVLTRYVTQTPAVWTSELAGLLFTWVVFVGAMLAFRDDKHIRVTLVLDLLPARARTGRQGIGDLLLIAFLLYTTWLSLQMMLQGATRLSPVIRIPFSWVYLATVIAFAVMSLTAILRLLGLKAAGEDAGEKDIP